MKNSQLILPGTSGLPLYMLVQRSVMLLQTHQPKNSPYYGCFSGGKDSVVIKELAKMAGIDVQWHYHNTTIDPPELVYFIRQHHQDVTWDKPRHGNFFRRMKEKLMVPTRWRRWCCAEYKEHNGPKKCSRIVGVRVAESSARSKRYTACTMPGPAKRLNVYPIRLWSDQNVWDFIKFRGIPYCSLYDDGFKRLGCVGCPLVSVSQRKKEFKRWPRYAKKWSDATWYIFQERKRLGKKTLVEEANGPDDLFEWWLNNS